MKEGDYVNEETGNAFGDSVRVKILKIFEDGNCHVAEDGGKKRNSHINKLAPEKCKFCDSPRDHGILYAFTCGTMYKYQIGPRGIECVLGEKIKNLKSYVERLEKAGDELDGLLESAGLPLGPTRIKWRAAKESKS